MTERQDEPAPASGASAGADNGKRAFLPDWFKPGRWTLVGTVLVGLGVVGYAAYLVLSDIDWTPETGGTIFVETPQVYTRERLVNDRFVQEAWLRNELEEKQVLAPSEVVTTIERQDRGVRTGPGSEQTQAAEKAAPPIADPPARPAPSLLPSVSFLLRNAHRELVRSHLIENQLDDRHDIRGTTIYMLKFDASVLPGNNTRKGAFVRVRATQESPRTARDSSRAPQDAANAAQDSKAPALRTIEAMTERYLRLAAEESPATNPELEDDFSLYTDWRRSLQDRFNSQFAEILRRFNANDFRYPEYHDLAASIGRPAASEDLFFSVTNALAKLQADYQMKSRGDRFGEFEYRFHFAVKLVLFLAAAGNAQPDFEKLRNILDAKEPATLPKGIDLEPLRQVLLRYAIQRLGKVVIGDNSLALVGRPTSTTAAVAQSKTLDSFVAIALKQLERDEQETFELEVDERLVRLAAFDSQEVRGILEDGCRDSNNKPLSREFEKIYTLLTQYKEGTRDVSVYFEKMSREDHPNPQSLFQPKLKLLTAERLKIALGSKEDTAAPEPFDSCLKFSRRRTLQVGWLNFVSGILDMQTYTYATFPRYDALISDTTFDASRAEAISVSLQAAKTSAGIGNSLRQVARSMEAKPSVVGFSGYCSQPVAKPKANPAAPTQAGFCRNESGTDDLVFGWALYPPTRPAGRHSEHISYRPMPPTQRALSALVTVPSFWKHAKLKVETGWINLDGSFTLGDAYDYTVTLPLDYEALDTILVGPARRDSHRPSIAIERLPDSIFVEACQRAEILIPGRRLWRSTVVVLGGQRANEVVVLPDMRGIIATFREVAARAELPGEPGDGWTERELQVWTSEGAATPLAVYVLGRPGPCSTARRDPAAKQDPPKQDPPQRG